MLYHQRGGPLAKKWATGSSLGAGPLVTLSSRMRRASIGRRALGRLLLLTSAVAVALLHLAHEPRRAAAVPAAATSVPVPNPPRVVRSLPAAEVEENQRWSGEGKPPERQAHIGEEETTTNQGIISSGSSLPPPLFRSP